MQGQVNFLVDRMHVGRSFLAVGLDIARRARRAKLLPSFRKQLVRWAWQRHEANRQLCRDFSL